MLLLLALGPTLGGFALYTLGLARMPAGVATLIGTLEPVFTITWAYFLFGEQLNPAQALGAGLILWSVVTLRPRDAATEEEKTLGQALNPGGEQHESPD